MNFQYRMRFKISLLIGCLMLLMLSSCSPNGTDSNGTETRTEEAQSAVTEEMTTDDRSIRLPKDVFQ